ncbi:MAG: hypothetical protein AABX75_00165 [Nanoarchaeota archaeon]
MALIHPTKVKQPDPVEFGLIAVLVIWSISVLWLLQMAATARVLELLSWTSLLAFFMAFASIVLVVIAILLADIRKELKMY